MFSNGNSTNFSTVRLRIIDIFSEADILNIKSWKKLNFRFPKKKNLVLAPGEKMQEKYKGQYPEQGQIQDFLRKL